MNELAIILALTAVAFVTRYPPLVIMRRVTLPHRAAHTLRFMPIAALTAIVVPTVFVQESALNLNPLNPYFVGGVVAVLLAIRSRSMLLVTGGSLAAFFLWRLVTGL